MCFRSAASWVIVWASMRAPPYNPGQRKRESNVDEDEMRGDDEFRRRCDELTGCEDLTPEEDTCRGRGDRIQGAVPAPTPLQVSLEGRPNPCSGSGGLIASPDRADHDALLPEGCLGERRGRECLPESRSRVPWGNSDSAQHSNRQSRTPPAGDWRMVATMPQSGPSGVLHNSRRKKSDEEGVLPESGLEVKRAARSTKRQEGGPVTPLLSPEVMARATAQTRFGVRSGNQAERRAKER